MPISALETSAQSIADTINNRDWQGLAARCDFNVKFEDVVTGQISENVQGFIDLLQGWVTTFPDLQVVLSNEIVSGEAVIMELDVKGRQSGEYPVADGVIPPTSREAAWRVCVIVSLTTHGPTKIAGFRLYYDVVTILDQLAEPLMTSAA